MAPPKLMTTKFGDKQGTTLTYKGTGGAFLDGHYLNTTREEARNEATGQEAQHYLYMWKEACAYTKWIPSNQFMYANIEYDPSSMTLERFGFIGMDKKCFWGSIGVLWKRPLAVEQILPENGLPTKKAAPPPVKKPEEAEEKPVEKKEEKPVEKKEEVPVKKEEPAAPEKKEEPAPEKKEEAPAEKKEEAPAEKKEEAPATKPKVVVEKVIEKPPPMKKPIQGEGSYEIQSQINPGQNMFAAKMNADAKSVKIEFATRTGDHKEHFTIRPIKDDIIAFESEEYPGFYLHSKKTSGLDQLDLKKSDKATVKAMDADPWAWFKLVPIKDKIFALESMRFPGYYVEDISVPFGTAKSHIQFRKSTLADAQDTVKGHGVQIAIVYAE